MLTYVFQPMARDLIEARKNPLVRVRDMALLAEVMRLREWIYHHANKRIC